MAKPAWERTIKDLEGSYRRQLYLARKYFDEDQLVEANEALSGATFVLHVLRGKRKQA